MRAPIAASLAAAYVAAGLAAAVAGGATPPSGGPPDPNPCHGPKRRKLACPNLQISPPADLFVTRSGRRRLLHATNSINSRGRGPAELRGHRTGPYTMAAVQVIHTRSGGKRVFDTGAHLGWKSIPGQGHYWKFRDAARFELWSLDSKNRPKRLVRVGEKQYDCLRDLFRTKPGRRSPGRAVYPGCNQDPHRRRVTLGTSVGWSDVYPADYHEQYIDVTGLRGRFGFFHIVDPANGIWETNELDNAGETIVRLPSGRAVHTRSRIDRPHAPPPQP